MSTSLTPEEVQQKASTSNENAACNNGTSMGNAAAPEDNLADSYARLRDATAEEKTEILLELIECHPEGRLVLPKYEGERAPLSEVNLSADALRARLSADLPAETPAWWNRELDAPSLQDADLRGANLRNANLDGADLRGTNFEDAVLGGSTLRKATLENVNLEGVDLVNANLEQAELEGTHLDSTLLENACFRGAQLRFAVLQGCALDEADFQDADLWGADLEGAFLLNTNLRGCQLREANLRGATLSAADLHGSDLREADLEGANLEGADLREATLGKTNLQGAVLRNARLQDMDFSDCNIQHVHLANAWLMRTRVNRKQLGEALGEERDRDYEKASTGYLNLEQNFNDLGNPEDARWAYIKKRTMHKLDARQRTHRALHQRHWTAAFRHGLIWAQAQFVEWICGYGESIPRTLASIFTVYVIFVLLYGLTGSVVHAGEAGTVVHFWPLSDLADLATFGLITMTTPEGPQVSLHPNGDLAHLLTSLQTLITIGLTGLLGYVLGNRIGK